MHGAAPKPVVDHADLTPETPTGTIATQLPGAIPVFQRLWIDFCSSQPMALSDAVDRAGAHIDEVLAELLALPRDTPDPDWRVAPLTDLLDLIESTHHVYTKRVMQELWELLRQAIEEDGERRPELHDIAKVIAPVFTDLGQHMKKEEEMLFPFIRKIYLDASARTIVPEGPMRMMEDEHDQAREAFHRLKHLTNDFRAPEGSGEHLVSLYAKLTELGLDLQRHIHLENNILHPRTRSLCDD